MATSDDRAADARKRLGQLVQDRRRELGLSVRAAADLGGVVRNTWASVEEGTRKTADSNYAGVERAMRWEPGSVAAVLDGGLPTPRLGEGEESGYGSDDEAIVKVMRSGLSDDRKRRLVRLLIEERENFEKVRLRRIQELIEVVGEPPA